VSHLYTARQIP